MRILAHLLLVCALNAAARDPREAAQRQEQGLAAFSQGRFAQAFELLESARSLDPRNPAIAHDLALSYHLRGRHSASQRILESIPEGLGRDGAYYALAGSNRRALGESGPALAAFKRAVILNPSNTAYLYDLGTALLETNAVEARVHFERAAARFPRDAKLRLGYGIALHMTGNTEKAEREIGEARRLEPDSPDLPAALGSLYDAAGDYAKASRAFSDALRLDPGDPALHLSLGRAQIKLQDEAAARASFERVLGRDRENPQALYELGRLAISRKDFAQATQLLERAIAADPSSAEAHYQLSLAAQRAGDPQKAAQAKTMFEQLRTRKP